MHRLKVGDIFEIPLHDGRMAYGRYLMLSRMGPIIQVFSLKSEKNVELNEIIKSPELFPPIITGLFAAIKSGFWKVIGNIPYDGSYHPKFLSTNYTQDGHANIWYLWDEENETILGKELPNKFKGLEYLVVWDPPSVVERIESGKIPFPYSELIRDNRFTPRYD
jgi:hypothetical protein